MISIMNFVTMVKDFVKDADKKSMAAGFAVGFLVTTILCWVY